MRILEDRFVFVEYQLEEIGVEVSPYTIMVDDKPLTMKRVVVEDFKIKQIDKLRGGFTIRAIF